MAGYEAGGVDCVVIAPSAIARVPGDRVKTDRRDAAAIARLLRNGKGERVHVPTPRDEAVRDYLRCRDDLRQELRRFRQRLQQCLIRHGHVYRGGHLGKFSRRFLDRCHALTPSRAVDSRSRGTWYPVVLPCGLRKLICQNGPCLGPSS